MQDRKFTIEINDDPELNARIHTEGDQFRKNIHWLSSHWHEVLPQARGQYVAVAGCEAFLAKDPIEAERLASQAHPEDKGVFVQFIHPEHGARHYGYRRRMDS